MRYVGRVNGRDVVIEAAEDGRLAIDGVCCDPELLELRPGVYSALVGGRSVDLYVASDGADGYRVSANGAVHRVELRDPRRWAAGRGGAAAGGPLAVSARMPGKVVRVLVSPGEAVEEGQPLLVIEAMKMQNEIRAPRAGRVASLDIVEGASVAAGQRLTLLE